MCQRCDRPLSQEAKAQVELYKALNWGLLYGRAGDGKNYAAAQKVRENVARMRRGEALHCKFINGKHIVGYLRDREPAKLPQKVCNYRQPKLYWFGELHGSNNLAYNPDFTSSARHWDVFMNKLKLVTSDYPAMSMIPYVKGRNPDDGTSMFFKELGDDIETFRGKRFVGISEVEEQQVTENFMKKITGDEWVETRTLSKPHVWKPQGEIFVMSGKPLKINEKSKETLEQVERIEYP